MNKILLIALLMSMSLGSLLAQQRNNVSEHVRVIISNPSASYLMVSQQFVRLDLAAYPIVPNQPYQPMVEQDITYDILSVGSNKRLVAQLVDGQMPPHTILEVRANPPQGASSHGFQPLSTTQQTIVSNINNMQGTNLEMRFRLRAELGAPILTETERTVRFTIMD